MPIELNPFTFQGRLTRAGFVTTTIILWVIGLIVGSVRGQSPDPLVEMILFGFGILLYILNLIAGVKRLRDLQQNPWWILLGFVPIANLVLGIYLLFWPSKYYLYDQGSGGQLQ